MEGSGLGVLSLGETGLKEEPECAVTDPAIKVEAELLNEEDCVKEELLCEQGALRGISEAAELAGLYLDHVVKDELVLGPEDFHQMNLKDALNAREHNRGNETYTTQADGESDEDVLYTQTDYDREPICDICDRRFDNKSDLMKHVIIHIDMFTNMEMEDNMLGVGNNGRAPGCNPGKEEFMLRDCSVRLERLPPRAPEPDRESHTEDDIYDRVDYDRQPICDICGSRFALKSDLMKHVVIHIDTPASTEPGDGGHDVAGASNHTFNTAGGCEQAVGRARSSRCALRDCRVWLERIPGIDYRAPLPHTPPRHKVNNIPHDNTEIETYICGTCGKIIQQKQDLIRHIQRHTQRRLLSKKQAKSENKPYSCICGKKFKDNVQLKSHNRIHTGEKPYSCEICSREFAHRPSLLIHKRLHTGEKPYYCEICHKRFTQSGTLKTHERIHTGQKRLSCTICKNKFLSLSGLNDHKRNHTGETYSCKVCEKQFSCLTSLFKHNRTHMGYSCELCKKHFSKLIEFRIHKRMHSGGTIYSCKVCQKKFVNPYNLKLHKLSHTGERPHSCEICGKRFKLLKHLKGHTRYHTGEKPFSCNICGKQFVEKLTLICHERAQHTGEKPYSCDICQKRFTQKTHLNTHKVVHTGEKPYACEICDKRFGLTQTLKIHKRVHTGETPYICNICGKRFVNSSGLSYHTRIHTGEKPYSCEICKKKFAHLRSAKAHRRSHEAE